MSMSTWFYVILCSTLALGVQAQDSYVQADSDDSEDDYLQEDLQDDSEAIQVNDRMEGKYSRRSEANKYREKNENETSVTTDIHCWMGNTRISQTCSLERCDYWITYNSTKAVKGFACIRVGYTVDNKPHVYRNCTNTVSSRYDPCETAILDADNPRVNVTSCEICWDNGCNIRGYKNNIWHHNMISSEEQKVYANYPPFYLTSWAWYILLLLWTALLLCCLYLTCRKMYRRPENKERLDEPREYDVPYCDDHGDAD